MVIGGDAPDFNAVNNSVIEKITNFLKNIQFDYDSWSVWMWAEGQEGNDYPLEAKDGDAVAKIELPAGTTSVGFIVRTQRGRIATDLSYSHLGIDPSRRPQSTEEPSLFQN